MLVKLEALVPQDNNEFLTCVQPILWPTISSGISVFLFLLLVQIGAKLGTSGMWNNLQSIWSSVHFHTFAHLASFNKKALLSFWMQNKWAE